MYILQQLPVIYRIAVLLGARVEVYHVDNNEWVNLFSFSSLGSRTKYRIVSEDSEIFVKIQELATEFYDIIAFDGYEYMVPKNSKTPGSIIALCSIYVERQKDGSLKQLELDKKEQSDMTKKSCFIGVAREEFQEV